MIVTSSSRVLAEFLFSAATLKLIETNADTIESCGTIIYRHWMTRGSFKNKHCRMCRSMLWNYGYYRMWRVIAGDRWTCLECVARNILPKEKSWASERKRMRNRPKKTEIGVLAPYISNLHALNSLGAWIFIQILLALLFAMKREN